MIPKRMLCEHNPPESYGDCFRACLASILEIEPEVVPHFAADFDDVTWISEVNKYLMQFNVGIISVSFNDNNNFETFGLKNIYHIICGKSPRFPSENHAVVGRDGKIVYNPSLSKEGLLGPEKDWVHFLFISFMKRSNDTDLANMMRKVSDMSKMFEPLIRITNKEEENGG